MSYDVVRDFKKIQSFKELQEQNAKLVAALMEIDHTLVVHGHIDRDTPLHERIRDAFQQSTEKP